MLFGAVAEKNFFVSVFQHASLGQRLKIISFKYTKLVYGLAGEKEGICPEVIQEISGIFPNNGKTFVFQLAGAYIDAHAWSIA